ncbi:cytochrome c oxidase copper chaperone isoform 1-T1 [Cyanocitta cristata]
MDSDPFKVCDSKEAGKQQHKAAVNVIAKFLIQNKGAFLPASREEEEEDVVTIPITKQSIIEKGEENCGHLIEAHKECMRALGFKI